MQDKTVSVGYVIINGVVDMKEVNISIAKKRTKNNSVLCPFTSN
jgi:hypothetical protein